MRDLTEHKENRNNLFVRNGSFHSCLFQTFSTTLFQPRRICSQDTAWPWIIHWEGCERSSRGCSRYYASINLLWMRKTTKTTETQLSGWERNTNHEWSGNQSTAAFDILGHMKFTFVFKKCFHIPLCFSVTSKRLSNPQTFLFPRVIHSTSFLIVHTHKLRKWQGIVKWHNHYHCLIPDRQDTSVKSLQCLICVHMSRTQAGNCNVNHPGLPLLAGWLLAISGNRKCAEPIFCLQTV
jgi:hypothetical protein